MEILEIANRNSLPEIVLSKYFLPFFVDSTSSLRESRNTRHLPSIEILLLFNERLNPTTFTAENVSDGVLAQQIPTYPVYAGQSGSINVDDKL